MTKEGKIKKEFEVLVVGELNVDIILNGMETMPSIGTEILADEMVVTLGSSSAIFASNISTLGVYTAFLGKIGQDDFGELVLDTLTDKHVNTDFIIRSADKKTGATVVLNYNNDRAMVTYPGAMEDLSVEEITVTHLERAKHLHVSSVFLQPGIKKDIVSLFKKAKEVGMTTSLDVQWDPAEKWDISFRKLLPLVDVFLPNEAELLAITGETTIDEAIKIIAPFANIIALKMGTKGSLGVHGKERWEQPPFLNNQVVDAIGAGDSFNAGFISTFIRGGSLQECLRQGNICGAVNTTAAGGTEAFASLESVRETARNKFDVVM